MNSDNEVGIHHMGELKEGMNVCAVVMGDNERTEAAEMCIFIMLL